MELARAFLQDFRPEKGITAESRQSMVRLPILAILLLASSISVVKAQSRCDAAITQFRGVIDHDERTGYLDPSVYRRMRPELRKVSAECAAGRDAEAIRELAVVKHRHGYH